MNVRELKCTKLFLDFLERKKRDDLLDMVEDVETHIPEPPIESTPYMRLRIRLSSKATVHLTAQPFDLNSSFPAEESGVEARLAWSTVDHLINLIEEV